MKCRSFYLDYLDYLTRFLILCGLLLSLNMLSGHTVDFGKFVRGVCMYGMAVTVGSSTSCNF